MEFQLIDVDASVKPLRFCRGMLEELMNDEEEVLDLNLSSRPRREERKKKREVDRQKRKLIRCGSQGDIVPIQMVSWVLGLQMITWDSQGMCSSSPTYRPPALLLFFLRGFDGFCFECRHI